MVFSLDVDQLYTLGRVLEGAWDFAQPIHMCFVYLEKAFDRVLRGVLWGFSGIMGCQSPLFGLFTPCMSQSFVRIAGSKSD